MSFGKKVPPKGTRVTYGVKLDSRAGKIVELAIDVELDAILFGQTGVMQDDKIKFGFIKPDDGGENMFVLPQHCQGFGEFSLPPLGTAVAYDVVLDDKTGLRRAENVRPTKKPVKEKPVKEKSATEKPATEKPATEKPVQQKRVSQRTDEPFADAEEFAAWRDERLKIGTDPQCDKCQSFDCWYAQICLVCMKPVEASNWESHANGNKHFAAYKALGGVSLRPGVRRPEIKHVQLTKRSWETMKRHKASGSRRKPPNAKETDAFIDITGFKAGMQILSLGEQDFSFSLKIAQLQKEASQPVQVVATSDRALPSMRAASPASRLGGNIAELKECGGTVFHNVDTTDLTETLLPQLQNQRALSQDFSFTEFDIVVFPFPRYSLGHDIMDPGNSMLLRRFFRSVNETRLLSHRGVVQLVMNRNEYERWDTACMAAEAGFELKLQWDLPIDFYQSRKKNGKKWTPLNGCLYIFAKTIPD
jgi:cold shock CspA family protein